MFARGFLMFILVAFSVLINAEGCPPGPFACVPWTGPNTPNPASPPPTFFRIEINEEKSLNDLYKYIEERPDDVELYINTKNKYSVLEQSNKYKQLIDGNSLYYMQLKQNRGVIFKGSELKK